jgi:anti-anti-sigma factor
VTEGPTRQDFELETVWQAERAVIVLGGELDLATAGRLEEALAEVAGTPEVVVDLRELEFMDSRGLQVLLQALGRAEAAGTVMALSGAPAVVERLLEVTGLGTRFPRRQL